MAERPQIGELQPFNDVEWAALAPNRHPMDVALEEHMRVYYKLDAKKFFVRATAWNGLVTTITMSDGLVSSAPQPGESWSDYEVSMLRLGRVELEEIRSTGDCNVSIFTHGGLKGTGSAGEKRVAKSKDETATDPGVRWTHVNFLSCFPVEMRLWSRPGHPTLPVNSSVTFEQCAAALRIRCENLYVPRIDAERLKLKATSDWVCVDYPFKIREGFPFLVFWLFQASCALKDAPGSKPLDVLKWLEENAPEEEWAIKGKPSIAVLAHPQYGRRAEFDDVPLADFLPARSLAPMRLPKPLCLLMAITEWWLDEIENGRKDRKALIRRLEDACFGVSVVPNLTRVISKKGITLEERSDDGDVKALQHREWIREMVRKSGSPDVALLGFSPGKTARAHDDAGHEEANDASS